MPDRFGESVENRSHPRRIAVAQHPRRLLVDIAVGVADDAPDRFECQVKSLLRDVLSDGNRRARAVAAATMDAVRSAMGLKLSATLVR